jgi:hypothetical protein
MCWEDVPVNSKKIRLGLLCIHLPGITGFLLTCTVFILGCTSVLPQYVVQWSDLEVGMNRDRVRDLLGEPDAVLPPLRIADAIAPEDAAAHVGAEFVAGLFGVSYERWSYGESAFLEPSEGAFVVYFDSEGRVNGYRRPRSGRYSTVAKTDQRPPHAIQGESRDTH